ncbi:hypothetical protein ACQKMV_22745, partial [Lysinibacillus sp. NPDC094403]|uniref:hypothetical protein n=1 Tax=Lysinibacillus sp. NPDC094403 TaxID=3390581 RepID=UPI003D03B784
CSSEITNCTSFIRILKSNNSGAVHSVTDETLQAGRGTEAKSITSCADQYSVAVASLSPSRNEN